nr:MAG TPA: hypothetical protein [Caudoviricetes sp.]
MSAQGLLLCMDFLDLAVYTKKKRALAQDYFI